MNGMMLSAYFAITLTHAHDEVRSALRVPHLIPDVAIKFFLLSDISEDREAVGHLGAPKHDHGPCLRGGMQPCSLAIFSFLSCK